MCVDAARCHLTHEVGRSSVQRIGEQSGEHTTAIQLACELLFSRGRKYSHPFSYLCNLMLKRVFAKCAAVATIQDDDLVAGRALIGERHYVRQRQAVVAGATIACAQVAARRFKVSVASEVEQSNIVVVRKEL